MQRSDNVIKIIALILFLTMLCYIGFSLIGRLVSGAGGERTVLAVSQTINESYIGEGLMIRTEQLISGGGALCDTIAGDGEKVYKGMPVAALYASAYDLETNSEIESLTQQKRRLEELLSYEQAAQNNETAQALVSDGILRLSSVLNSGNFEELHLICDEVHAMIITSGQESYQQRIDDISAEIASLQGSMNSEVNYIYAPQPGIFCRQADGLEYLSPETLSTLTADGLNELMQSEGAVTGSEAGKLITGLRWQFAMNVPKEYADLIYEGGELTVRFPRWLDSDIVAEVESVGAAQDGYCLVVLSSDRNLAALSSVRVAAAELIFSSVTGIRVPREAAHVDEDGAYVYTLVGIQADRKNIEIIAETEDYYLVVYDALDSGGLREGNEIMVNYSGLYDGKVIE